ncbi:MAG: Xaa-Pro peptidase family protein [Pseudomonadota bacterium]
MQMTKRHFLASSASAMGLAGLGCESRDGGASSLEKAASSVFSVSKEKTAAGAARNFLAQAQPISLDERLSRVAKAQRLMQEGGVAALVLEPGASLDYFTGVSWWRSERFTGAILPADGEIAFVTPAFEEPSVRESMTFGDDVRVWQEHEDPFALVAGVLADRGLQGGAVAIEETVRRFISDGVAEAAPNFSLVSGVSIVRGCRMIKSSAELSLMQTANDITLDAYKSIFGAIEAGMTPDDAKALMNEATAARGGRVKFAGALFGEASAYPHGTKTPQVLKEGDMILMDCGCSVYGYQSDISRSWVLGEPTRKQRSVWKTVKEGQELVLETAQIGAPAGAIDDAVRAYYETQGFGPGYRTPGLSHRVGHGIGMDVHEQINFVRGEATPLQPGMCLSNEPGIYIFGEFGVRLEDCLYMTDDGPRLFTDFSPSIDAPFG